jgi:cell division transport system ATP-binding protein
MQIAVQVSELTFTTDEGVPVLEGFSLGVPRDGFVVVVGPPSSGKTLLLRLILRELPPTGGQILLVGRNVARLSPKKVAQLRRRVGYLPQPPVLLTDRTLEENLLFKLRPYGLEGKEREEELERALAITGLEARRTAPVAELTPLEARRAALAVAACPQPVVLLADDPFRDLSEADQDAVLETLFSIWQAGTALLVTAREDGVFHRRTPLPSQPKLVHLRQGVEG